jgi:hypothetical protein
VVTHYEVLGVAQDAPPDEIKRAYYERARLYHPDAHAASSTAVRVEAERTMQALNSSWTVLRDPLRRRRYDRHLARDDEERDDLVGATTATSVRGKGRIVADQVPSARRAATGSTTPRPVRPRTERPGRDLTGFQYWFGAHRGGLQGLNLRIKGPAASLTPLRALVPDGLVALHAEYTDVDDQDLRSLLGMRSLRFLDLTATQVGDAGLVHLLACVDLEVLCLWNTLITDDALDLVGRLPNLRHLGLGNTRVTDDGLRHLARLQRLRVVQLTGTDVNGSGLRHLHDLPELEMITLPWRVRGGHRRRLRRARPGVLVSS